MSLQRDESNRLVIVPAKENLDAPTAPILILQPEIIWAALERDLIAARAARREARRLEEDVTKRLAMFMLGYGQRAEAMAGTYPRMLSDLQLNSKIADKWFRCKKRVRIAEEKRE